ncbi:MAG: hypothetical protein AAB367_02135 [Patescibacteria group bacterium]
MNKVGKLLLLGLFLASAAEARASEVTLCFEKDGTATIVNEGTQRCNDETPTLVLQALPLCIVINGERSCEDLPLRDAVDQANTEVRRSILPDKGAPDANGASFLAEVNSAPSMRFRIASICKVIGLHGMRSGAQRIVLVPTVEDCPY